MRVRGRVMRIMMSGLAAAALTCTVATGVAQAAYPGGAGRIAFVRSGNIFTIEPDGTGLRQLTTAGGDSAPRWSPNGKSIAYLDHGNLWIMRASGSHKRQVTSAAPGFTDARPSWSPNGRYLAFVKTAARHVFGYLTRYDTVTHRFATFSTPFASENPTVRQVKVMALPAPVAWTFAWTDPNLGPSMPDGYFILFNGYGASGDQNFCQRHFYCLDALGMIGENQHKNGFPSAEDQTHKPTRLLDPDWFPEQPPFDTDAMTTVEHCTSAGCTHKGIRLQIGQPTIIPGAYQAVYSPIGRQIVYVLNNQRGTPQLYIAPNSQVAGSFATLLTNGSQPDWQPLTAPPPAR
jgi:hypothetical protein